MSEPQIIDAEPQDETVAEPAPGSLFSRISAGVSRLMENPRAPLVFGLVVALGVGGYALKSTGVIKGVPVIGTQQVVVFDPVKFINAQRAAASILSMAPNADTALSLTQVAKQAESVIREEAGGSIVLVRQSVVNPEGLEDITNAVLSRFGLPTDVPTVSIRGSDMALESIAPTDAAFGPGKLREDYRIELQNRTDQLLKEGDKAGRQSALTP